MNPRVWEASAVGSAGSVELEDPVGASDDRFWWVLLSGAFIRRFYQTPLIAASRSRLRLAAFRCPFARLRLLQLPRLKHVPVA